MRCLHNNTNWPNTTGGIKGYYPFNGNANDESGNGNHGTVHGATLTTDRFGTPNSAYKFDGIDDYIEINDNEDFNLTNWTITGWIRLLNTPDIQSGIIAKDENGNEKYNFSVLCDSNYLLRTQYETCNNEYDHPLYSDTICLSDWIFFCSSRNQYDGSFRLYINGILVDSIYTNDSACASYQEAVKIGTLYNPYIIHHGDTHKSFLREKLTILEYIAGHLSKQKFWSFIMRGYHQPNVEIPLSIPVTGKYIILCKLGINAGWRKT